MIAFINILLDYNYFRYNNILLGIIVLSWLPGAVGVGKWDLLGTGYKLPGLRQNVLGI